MSEVSIKLNVPSGYEQEVRGFVEEIKFDELFMKSFKHCIEVELRKKLLKGIASHSRLSAKEALELGEAVKEGWAEKHAV